MIQTTHESVSLPLRYGDPDKEPGRFFALSHAESTCSFVQHDTTVTNARLLTEPLRLDRNGIELVKQTTAVTDFFDEQQTETIYKPEIEALIQRLTGATKVVVFHTLARDEGPDQRAGRRPARNAHIDYTEDSFKAWARHVLGDAEADRRIARPWTAINVWRGIRPVESTPLAVCDGGTVRDEDLVNVPIWLRPDEPHEPAVSGRNLVWRPHHRWYYYPLMQTDEALVFRLADSDHGKPRLSAHSAFDDPTTPPGAQPRASYEVRTLAFFD